MGEGKVSLKVLLSLKNKIIGKEKKMTNIKNKTTAISIVMVLMLSLSALVVSIPNVSAKISFTMSTGFYPIIGENSPTLISWVPTPADSNPLANPTSGYYKKTPIWPNATATFTRPDGTKDVINGPFKQRSPPPTMGQAEAEIVLVYPPNMQGKWNVTFHWPGDDTYNAINQTNTFIVGSHFEKRDCWAFLSIKPYPVVGLGQDILINAWVTPPPITARDYFEDYLFTFTPPTGNSFTVGPMNSELTASVWFNLPLTELGNWTIKFNFPGDFMYKPCSVTRTITVQQAPVPVGYPDTPLPAEPWTFPINTENREWRNIAGPWEQTNYNASSGAWNPYTEGVRTPHVLWKLPSYGQLGGYIGSPHSIETGGGSAEYEAGDVGLYSSSVPSIKTVMAGRGYYTAGTNIICVDMQTGKQLWSVPGSFNVGSRRGSTSALYSFSSSRFIAYNAITGAVILNVTGISMSFYEDPYVYSMTGTTYDRLIKWTTVGSSTNFTTRILWNVSNPMPSVEGIPWPAGASVESLAHHEILDGVWIMNVRIRALPVGSSIIALVKGINTTTGETMYAFDPILNHGDIDEWWTSQGPATGSGYGLFYQAAVRDESEGRSFIARDVKTGAIKWVSENADYPWGNFWAYTPMPCAYGMIYGHSYSGVYAFNVTNGKIVWHFIDNDTYNEEPYASNINATDGSTYSSFTFGSVGGIVGGGILYAPDTEHSPTFIYRGQGLCAVNAFTGELLWKIKGVYTPTAIAYGVLLASDSYNGFTYAFAKGETATAISMSSKVIAKGDSTLIEGTVLDMSPAQEDTAAVSDDSQTAWMEYLHMQQPFPVNAKGVTVSLDALDPNNNYVHIGNATSDITGKYSFLWTPEIEGKYNIIASFMGSEAYYGSTAETSIGVTNAPATPAPPMPLQTVPDPTMPIVGMGVAILAAVAIVGLMIVRVLRKKP